MKIPPVIKSINFDKPAVGFSNGPSSELNPLRKSSPPRKAKNPYEMKGNVDSKKKFPRKKVLESTPQNFFSEKLFSESTINSAEEQKKVFA